MEREAARYLPASPDPDLPARLLLLAAALAVPSAAARNGTLDAGFRAAGYLADGSPDAGFGSGRALADVGASDLALGLAFEATGRVVLAGTTGDVDGETTLLDVARFLTDGRPAAAAPNGFGAQTALTLTLAEAGAARVAVYDALGRRVAVLHDGPLAAGVRRFRVDGAGLAPGVYAVCAEGAGGGAGGGSSAGRRTPEPPPRGSVAPRPAGTLRRASLPLFPSLR